MSMNQIPTLVLGLGGIGCKIAAAVSDSLSYEDRKYVSVIGIDTNVNDIAKLKDKHKMEIIQISDDMDVSDYLEEHPEYSEWFPENPFLRKRTMTDGAGQVRTLSRLAFLAAVESGRFNVILQEITRIRKVDDNPHSGKLMVVVVGSITGGTGAGLFLNMPFYIRDLIKSQTGLRRCAIRGMFVGPDVLEDVQPSKTNRDAVCVNGYSCIKELNAFYMKASPSQETIKNLRIEYYDHDDVSVQDVPYDYFYLVEKSGGLGTMGDSQIDEIINYIAHVLFVMMFSPITADTISIEDNFVAELIGRGGMNRYTGAGMCRLVYPVNSAQEYVTLCVVRDLVKKEWLLIDQEFNALTQAALAKMVSDSTVEKPKIKTSYVEIFEKETQGDHAKLAKFAKEAYVVKDSKRISRAKEFIKNLDDIIEELLDSDAIKAKEEACRIDDQKMKNFSDAEGQINNVWEGMRSYSQYAKYLISTKPNGFADDLFPTSREVMDMHKEKSICIYQFLAKVHPVTARFLIYDIINELEKKLESLKEEITDVDLSEYTKVDFDIKKEGVQGPGEYLGALRDKRNPIWKWLGPVGKAVNSEEKALVKLKRRLHEVCDAHISTTHDFLENSLKYKVSELVLERMVQLAENYAIFFSTVSSKIDRNNENIDRLENIHFPFGQGGIYCSKDAFRRMAADFMARQPQELSDETKAAIFEQIYLVQARSYTITGTAETKAEKERRVHEDKKKLELIFNTAVIETVKNSVNKHGMGIVNLNAREALTKEFELNEHMVPDDPDYKIKLKEYAQDRIETALKVASPMLATESTRAEIAFMAIDPVCAETDPDLNPDTSETARFYLKNTGMNVGVIINDEFANTEISCMRLSYNFTIEDLIKYRKNARNSTAYENRIKNIGLKTNPNGNWDEMMVVVTPHLNRHWHEEGFLPSIHGKQRAKDHMDTLKAFIYGMALDCFRLIKDDEHPDEKGNPRLTWFSYTNGSAEVSRIMKCGRLIGNGYSDVFDSIRYNRKLKLAILHDARVITEKMKGYRTAEELLEGILENWFVEDLVQSKDSKDIGDKNIFDIFLDMRSHMPEEEWEELFNGLIRTLWEFCGILFDDSEVMINKAVRNILTEIYDNCSVGKKAESELRISEQRLKDQYKNLMARSYGEK